MSSKAEKLESIKLVDMVPWIGEKLRPEQVPCNNISYYLRTLLICTCIEGDAPIQRSKVAAISLHRFRDCLYLQNQRQYLVYVASHCNDALVHSHGCECCAHVFNMYDDISLCAVVRNIIFTERRLEALKTQKFTVGLCLQR